MTDQKTPGELAGHVAKRILGKIDVLNADDLRTAEVEVPEWGGVLIVRELTGDERDSWEASVITTKGSEVEVSDEAMKGARARLVALVAIDSAGARLFCEADAAALGRKSATALNRVFEVASRLSGLSADDVEELAKNSPGPRPVVSGSNSR